MQLTDGTDRAFEMLMQQTPGFDSYSSGCVTEHEGCDVCRFYRPHWTYQYCVYAECPYELGELTAKRKRRRKRKDRR